ncbi:unnamed protein product [Lasius platythorax]|uniref:Reverse transcriptase Ty1/copia-type domain-containing protein n=1 Tax=Lasius platythorax TaxID=488582 RepID=A0AAV2MY90_9HYME
MTEHAYATVEADKRGGVWHRRLGHIGNSGMKQLVKTKGKELRDSDLDEGTCDVCIQGKQSRKPFPSSGYRLIDPDTKKIIISRDVIFREDRRNTDLFILPIEEDKELLDKLTETKPKPTQIVPKKKITEIPKTYKEAMNSSEHLEWLHAMQEELKALERNDTWEETELSPGKKQLSAKWIYQKKETCTGEPRHKARLVAKGCAQIQGRNYEEVFSPVVKYNTIRFLLAMVAEKEWTATNMDVKTAYLNSELKEEIYLIPPEGVPKNHGKIWKLKKAIY